MLGPVYGTCVAFTIGQRWVYSIPTSGCGIYLLLFLTARETRSDVVLSQYLRKVSKNDTMAAAAAAEGPLSGLWTLKIQDSDAGLSFRSIIIRPLRFLFTEPLVLTTTVLCTFSQGLIYVFTVALHMIYTSPGFHFSYPISSLHFLGYRLRHLSQQSGLFPRHKMVQADGLVIGK